MSIALPANNLVLSPPPAKGLAPAPAVPGDSLAGLVQEIKDCLRTIDTNWRTTLAKAIRAGELLTQAKDTVDHGEWGPWLKNNFNLINSGDTIGFVNLALVLVCVAMVVSAMGSGFTLRRFLRI